MTTDDFTKAARAEAERRHPAPEIETGDQLGYTQTEIREVVRRTFTNAAEWARAHLAAQEDDGHDGWCGDGCQEPTDAETWENKVAAALPERYDGEEDQRDIILRAVKDMAERETQEPTDAEVEAAAYVLEMIDGMDFREVARAALSAARAARRDEEGR